MILKQYKNMLLDAVQESGLDATLFSAQNGTIDKKKWFVIQLRNSMIRFAVRPYGTYFDRFEITRSVYSQSFPLSLPALGGDAKALSGSFKSWLDEVVKPYLDELAAPDLWQILESNLSEAMPEAERPDYSQPFSEEEKAQLRLSINEFSDCQTIQSTRKRARSYQ